MINSDQLYELSETAKGARQKAADLLLQAFNDWRNPVTSLDEYSTQLKNHLNSPEITATALSDRIKKLRPQSEAWEIESISSLLEAFSMSNTENLESLNMFLSKEGKI